MTNVSKGIIDIIDSYRLPSSAKPGDNFIVTIYAKNIGSESDNFTVKLFNADTGLQIQNSFTKSLSPGQAFTYSVPVTMHNVPRPLRLLAKLYIGDVLQCSDEYSVAYDAPSPPKATIEHLYTNPTSAKPLDVVLGYVKVKNVGGQVGDFDIKWINADTGAQIGITQRIPSLSPGNSMGNNVNITMPNVSRPLRISVKVYYKGNLQDSKEVTVTYITPPAPVTPAKGKLLNIVLPTSKILGSTAKLSATIKNIGGTTRKFRAALYRVAVPAVFVAQTPVYTISPGKSVNIDITWRVPTSGASVRYNLRCVNVDDFSLDDHKNFDVKLTESLVCIEGEKRNSETCYDGSVIHKEVCRGNKWVSTGEACPTPPPAHIPLTITSIDNLPDSSKKGEFVQPHIHIKNQNTSNTPITLKTYVNGTLSISTDITAAGSKTTTHVRGFHMPNSDVVFTAKLYYNGTLESEMSKTISLSTPDPCAGITCPNTCDGTSLYSQKCVNGHCVKDSLIESNSSTCGYVPPADEPHDEPDTGGADTGEPHDEPDIGEPDIGEPPVTEDKIMIYIIIAIAAALLAFLFGG